MVSRKNNNIQLSEWAPYSPDLNPIEKCLKEKLKNQYPELRAYGGGGKAAIQTKLGEVLSEVWRVTTFIVFGVEYVPEWMQLLG